MTASTPSSAARDLFPFAQTASGEGAAADEFAFRAPRHGDLVVCPYCPSRSSRCDYCGGEGSLFASDLTYFEENQYGRA